MVDDNRRLWKYIIFSALTGGIYGFYFIYKLAKDVNVICEGDGQETPGLWKYILFGVCTVGIYDLYWMYKLADRLQINASRYGTVFSENGATVLKWAVFGLLLVGIGPFVSLYIIIKNTNILAEKYRMGAAVHNSEEKDFGNEKAGVLDFKCPKCGHENEKYTLFCSECGAKLEWSDQQETYEKSTNKVWIPITCGCAIVGLALLLYLAYFFSWISPGRNLASCVGKKLSLVKIMHHVEYEDDIAYYIDDYMLDVDTDTNIVKSISKTNGEKRAVEKYNIEGIYYNQSQKEAKKCLKDHFVSLGAVGYIPKGKSDYVFSVRYDQKKVNGLSLTYWKQSERESEWLEEAELAKEAEDYGTACVYYEAIVGMNVKEDLEECRYSYAKELYDKGAYLDARKYFNKLTSDLYEDEKETCLQKINELVSIFNLDGQDVDQRSTWYEEDAGTMGSQINLIFDEDSLDLYQGDSNAYAVESWKAENESDSDSADNAWYQLVLRRLSDDSTCNAAIGIHVVDTSLYQDVDYVSCLSVAVPEDDIDRSQKWTLGARIYRTVTKVYTNSKEYNEQYQKLNELR